MYRTNGRISRTPWFRIANADRTLMSEWATDGAPLRYCMEGGGRQTSKPHQSMVTVRNASDYEALNSQVRTEILSVGG